MTCFVKLRTSDASEGAVDCGDTSAEGCTQPAKPTARSAATTSRDRSVMTSEAPGMAYMRELARGFANASGRQGL